jgi:hypothetical protein
VQAEPTTTETVPATAEWRSASEARMDQTPPGTPGAGRRPRFWAEVSGALAVGLSALAAVVVAFQILSWARGMPGPGLLTVAGHLGAAALAVLVQRFADRTGGRQGALAVLGVLVVTCVTLWFFWWA